MDRLSLNQEAALRLIAAERAIDAALSAQNALVACLLTARGQARVAAPVGDEAIGHAAAAVSALAVARGEAVACHAALAQVRADLGLPAVAVGQGDKDPPEPLQPHGPKPHAQARGG